MRIPRIFQKTPLKEGIEVTLDEEASHHISRVLRMPEGANIIIFNGEGGEYQAIIVKNDKHHTHIKTQQFIYQYVPSPLKIHLGQVMSRGDKMDFTIQKAVELGVNEITPLISSHCEVKLSGERADKKQAHWENIIINACEQCGRTDLPILNKIQSLHDWMPSLSSSIKLMCHPNGAARFKDLRIENEVSLLIGPEGGFSENEIELAKTTQFNVVQLGPRVLRTETAGLTIISILQGLFGDI